MTEPSVNSPCVRNCCLDANDMCLGCGRLLEEILNWQGSSDEEKRQIVERAKARLENRNY